MTEKDINRWLRRRFTVLGWVLLGYYLLMNLLATLGMTYEALRQLFWAMAAGMRPDIDANAMTGNAWGYILTAVIGMILLHGWKGSDYWRQEIFAWEKGISPGTLGCLLCLCVGAQMVNTYWVTGMELVMNLFDRSLMPMLESVSGANSTLSLFLYSTILAPISEEILFRGYILRSLRPFGKRFAIFGSAFLFGLFHGNLLQTPYAFLVGLILGYVTVEYSIWWAILIHGFNNLVLADLLARLTMGLPEIVQSLVNGMLFGGGLFLSLVLLVLLRREIQAYRRSEWMDRRALKCFFLSPGIFLLTLVMAGNMILMLVA